jgi:hypothetical protein
MSEGLLLGGIDREREVLREGGRRRLGNVLDDVACEYDGVWVRLCFVPGCDTRGRATAAQSPPEVYQSG